MLKIALALAALAAFSGTAAAQTATPTPPSATGNPVRPAPRGPVAGGDQPQVGAPTSLDRHEEHESEKAAGSVCKGC